MDELNQEDGDELNAGRFEGTETTTLGGKSIAELLGNKDD